MEVQVEALVVDPERPGETAGDRQDALTQTRRQVQPGLRDAGDILVRERAVLARGEHGHARHVHVHGRALEIQEARVQAGQALGRHNGQTVPKC